MNILFSLLVHENNDIVRLTIASIQKNVKNCVIVIHKSMQFTDFDQTISEIPKVYVNDISYTTVHGASQFGLHCQNYLFAVHRKLDFTHFCIAHTSEMFVKPGIEELIAKSPYSLWYNRATMPRNMQWHPMLYANQIGIFDNIVPDRSWYLGSLIEGTWIIKEIMDKIVDYARRNPRTLSDMPGWTFEEVAFPTLLNWFGDERVVEEPYNAFFDKNLETSDVDKIVNGEPVELWAMNCWNKSSVPILSDGSKKFSVKRLNRDINDPVRQHIISLTELDISAILIK